MMFLSNGHLSERRNGRTIALGAADPMSALLARGHSPTVAAAIAAGDLSVRLRALDLARLVGLICLVDTSAGRAAGLLR
jgi:hypothetical protein